MTSIAIKPISKSRRAFSQSLVALPAAVSTNLCAAMPTSGQRVDIDPEGRGGSAA